MIEAANGALAFDVVPETIARVKPFGASVNVEPALRAGDPLGGHNVQGHVDGVGRVAAVEPEGDGVRARIEAAPELLRYCVEKGRSPSTASRSPSPRWTRRASRWR